MVAAVEQGEFSIPEIASLFSVGKTFIKKMRACIVPGKVWCRALRSAVNNLLRRGRSKHRRRPSPPPKRSVPQRPTHVARNRRREPAPNLRATSAATTSRAATAPTGKTTDPASRAGRPRALQARDFAAAPQRSKGSSAGHTLSRING